MSLKSQETIGANQRKITFTVDRPTFDKAVDKVYRRQVKSITIPGFRKGHAPRAIIERMYGKEVFFEDAVNEIIPDAYEEAAKEITETVVSRPEFNLVSASVEDGVVLSCTFFVKPEVVNDSSMAIIAKDIAHRIENELEYPGQIKINVIRESRSIEYAK